MGVRSCSSAGIDTGVGTRHPGCGGVVVIHEPGHGFGAFAAQQFQRAVQARRALVEGGQQRVAVRAQFLHLAAQTGKLRQHVPLHLQQRGHAVEHAGQPFHRRVSIRALRHAVRETPRPAIRRAVEILEPFPAVWFRPRAGCPRPPAVNATRSCEPVGITGLSTLRPRPALRGQHRRQLLQPFLDLFRRHVARVHAPDLPEDVQHMHGIAQPPAPPFSGGQEAREPVLVIGDTGGRHVEAAGDFAEGQQFADHGEVLQFLLLHSCA